jgi:predicted Rossmann-fold nucleotide-binding protein
MRSAGELIPGFRALHFIGPCVTVFGSARFGEQHPYYRLGRATGAELARAGFTVTDSARTAVASITDTAKRAFGLTYGSRMRKRWIFGER